MKSLNSKNAEYPYDVYPTNWRPYNEKIDYCGPEGEWYSKIISRYIFGADCNLCYWAHDQRYQFGQTSKERKFADKQMRRDQDMIIKEHFPIWNPLRVLALLISLRRYHMVRWFGRKPYANKRVFTRL